MMTYTLPPISLSIWESKYRLKELDGTPIDTDIQATWRRVAKALAAPEAPDRRKFWEDAFFRLMDDGLFSPAGRIIAGAGSNRNVTLSNCFTMGAIPDSMEGIFSHLKEAALTMQAGGGIGYDFSTLRPKGAPVVGVAADASGPLTFMDVWDAMCRTVMSAGSRRGAMMATMRCDHPDIEAFIEAKGDAARLRMFNLSVLVTDDFMNAVESDLPWRLHFENRRGETLVERTVKARDLWAKIMKSTYEFAEPGVIFIDRVNQQHNLNYLETVATTNPCGEKPMGPYASCLLGSINLARFVKYPFQDKAGINAQALQAAVRTAIRLMDNVIEAGRFPLPQQEAKAKSDRQLGLGVTGLADALMMMGITYGSDEAVRKTRDIMREICLAAYETSIELAKEKGPFATLDVEKFLAPGTFASVLPDKIKQGIETDGIRNSLLVSIAPTGTISLFAGNVSSGIEPVFAASYMRKVLQPDGSRIEELVEDYAIALWKQQRLDDTDPLLPPAYVDAQTLPPEAHVRMQAAAQEWVDSSISKTVNLPEDISFEHFEAVYLLAYQMGCKGCTTYRPNKITGSILSVEPKKPEVIEVPGVKTEEQALREARAALTENAPHDGGPGYTAAQAHPPAHSGPMVRPEALDGTTYKLKWPGQPHAIYVTINNIEAPDGRLPFEVFINTKNTEHQAWTSALTLMISAIFRRGGDVAFVAEELKAIVDPRGGSWEAGQYIPSMLAAIGGVIQRHIKAIGFGDHTARVAPGVAVAPLPGPEIAVPRVEATVTGKPCPSCSSFNFKHEAGCATCNDCGWSQCG